MPETEQKFDPILDLAIQNGFVDDQMVAELREEQQRTGHQMRDLLLDMEVASEEEILAMLAAYQGCDVIDLAGFEIPPDTVQSIPARIARMYNVIPVYESVNMVKDTVQLPPMKFLNPLRSPASMTCLLTGSRTMMASSFMRSVEAASIQ